MRRDGFIPAIIYGKGTESIAITISPKEIVTALAGVLRINTPLDINIKGGGKDVPPNVLTIVADHQYHPLKRDLLHVDFVAIKEDEPINIQIPVNVSGRSIGEQTGGIVMQIFRTVPIKCLPKNIPEALVLDISAMDVGDVLSVKDLDLPENVSCVLDLEQSIVSVVAPKKVVEETTETGEETEAGEGEGEKTEGEEKADEGEKKE